MKTKTLSSVSLLGITLGALVTCISSLNAADITTDTTTVISANTTWNGNSSTSVRTRVLANASYTIVVADGVQLIWENGAGASFGGAIGLDNNATLNITGNVLFRNNEAGSAGGYNTGSGAIGFSAETYGQIVNVTGATFQNNRALAGRPGGVTNNGNGTGGQLTFTDCIFDGNGTVGGNDGGVVNQTSNTQCTTVFNNCNFTNNDASGNGGVFWGASTVTFNYTQSATAIGNTSGTGAGFLHIYNTGAAGYGQLATFDISSGATFTVGQSGNTSTDSIGGSGYIVKQGAGTLVLHADSSQLGNDSGRSASFTVQEGTLRLGNSGAKLGSTSNFALNVKNAATFSGSGEVGGTTTIENGGILLPDGLNVALTFDTLNLQAGAALRLSGENTVHASVLGFDNLLAGQIGVVLGSFADGLSAGDFVTLLTFDSSSGFSADANEHFTINSGQSGNFVWKDDGVTKSLVFGSISAIPEPSSYASIVGVAILACAGLRRRRK